ncbi:hypothetical protein [Flaviaesturariibacter amylovorans]|uniref:DUF2235 domain-containing protein n=1 Tax=Flaviaesturariibacter amylovorans TaxID=1084520 RepID=A0ABP8HRF5_9BACT
MIDIVICVDGTNSKTYKNSSVRNFYHSVQAQEKVFHDGPSEGGGIAGADWLVIRNQLRSDLDRVARKYGEESFFNGYQCTIGRNPGFRFILVGHSRGGHVVIHLAAMLKYRSHFMGLYDAVERTSTRWDSFSRTIYNVDHVFHARRHPEVGSRTAQPLAWREALPGWGWGSALATAAGSRLMDFGNTGTSTGDGGAYQERLFRTSHGGIGGDVLTEAVVGIPLVDDTSCAVTLLQRSAAQQAKRAGCLVESREADEYIRRSARLVGVRI